MRIPDPPWCLSTSPPAGRDIDEVMVCQTITSSISLPAAKADSNSMDQNRTTHAAQHSASQSISASNNSKFADGSVKHDSSLSLPISNFLSLWIPDCRTPTGLHSSLSSPLFSIISSTFRFCIAIICKCDIYIVSIFLGHCAPTIFTLSLVYSMLQQIGPTAAQSPSSAARSRAQIVALQRSPRLVSRS